MKKYLKWAVVVFIGLIVIGAVAGGGKSNKTTTSAPTSSQKEVKSQEPQKITAQELADDFDANQLAGEKKWNGKLVEFNAEVSNINDSGLSFYNVSSKEFSATQISCRVSDKESLLTLKNGETVTVRGVVGKQTIGVIDISDCQVVK